jgi:hypothetical protein
VTELRVSGPRKPLFDRISKAPGHCRLTRRVLLPMPARAAGEGVLGPYIPQQHLHVHLHVLINWTAAGKPDPKSGPCSRKRSVSPPHPGLLVARPPLYCKQLHPSNVQHRQIHCICMSDAELRVEGGEAKPARSPSLKDQNG